LFHVVRNKSFVKPFVLGFFVLSSDNVLAYYR
jgi:hypothetical protein